MRDASSILTPEHVEIRLVPAGLGRRFLAVVIDGACAVVIAAALTLPLRGFLGPGAAYAVFTTVSFVVGWGWHVFFEAFGQGRSWGKRILGLRVVDARGLPVSLEQAFVRNIVRALDFAPLGYGMGALSCQLDGRRRRLGDIAADALVIREGRVFEGLQEIHRSPEFNSLRTPRVVNLVRRRLSLEEADFLLACCLREGEMSDRARFDLMEDVARYYREKLELQALPLSGQALVRGLTALVFWDRRAPSRRGAAPPAS